MAQALKVISAEYGHFDYKKVDSKKLAGLVDQAYVFLTEQSEELVDEMKYISKNSTDNGDSSVPTNLLQDIKEEIATWTRNTCLLTNTIKKWHE